MQDLSKKWAIIGQALGKTLAGILQGIIWGHSHYFTYLLPPCRNNTGTTCVKKFVLVESSQPRSSVVRASAWKEEGLGFNSRAGQTLFAQTWLFITPRAVIEKFVDDWRGFATKHACLLHISWSMHMHQCLAPPWRSPTSVGKLLVWT